MPHTSHAQPARRRSAEEQARLHQAITELWEQRITFNTVLGLKVESLDPASPRLRFDMRPELVGHFLYGRLHGGVISAALDAM
nr:thioesterase family protein [Sphaerotilus sp.]